MKSHNSTNKCGEIIILTPPVFWDPQPHFSVWSLPGPQVQMGFLGVLSSPGPMLCHCHHRERTQGGKCVGETWSTGVSRASWGTCRQHIRAHGPASGWSPNPDCALSRSCHSLSFPAPCHGAHSLGLRMTGERTEPPLTASRTAGKAGSSLTWSHFPPQEKPWG